MRYFATLKGAVIFRDVHFNVVFIEMYGASYFCRRRIFFVYSYASRSAF